MIFCGYNLIALISASLGAMGVGMLWYSPLLFLRVWLKEMGMKESDCTMSSFDMIAAFIINLCQAFGLAYIIRAMHITEVTKLCPIVTITLTIIGTGILGGVLWEKRSLKLSLLTIGHVLTSYIVMSAILLFFR